MDRRSERAAAHAKKLRKVESDTIQAVIAESNAEREYLVAQDHLNVKHAAMLEARKLRCALADDLAELQNGP